MTKKYIKVSKHLINTYTETRRLREEAHQKDIAFMRKFDDGGWIIEIIALGSLFPDDKLDQQGFGQSVFAAHERIRFSIYKIGGNPEYAMRFLVVNNEVEADSRSTLMHIHYKEALEKLTRWFTVGQIEIEA